VPAGLDPVFRNRDEVPAAGDLGSTITAALADSAALVVLCSPAAARSRWVNAETEAYGVPGAPSTISISRTATPWPPGPVPALD